MMKMEMENWSGEEGKRDLCMGIEIGRRMYLMM